MIDSTILRAHACATPKKNNQAREGLGRSCGGFSTKVYAVCDALGNPLRFIITPGQHHDSIQAIAIFSELQAGALLGDKGYDSDTIRAETLEQNITAHIPPRSNRLEKHTYDKHLYKERQK